MVGEGRNRRTMRATGRNGARLCDGVCAVRGKILKNWHYYDTANVLAPFRGGVRITDGRKSMQSLKLVLYFSCLLSMI